MMFASTLYEAAGLLAEGVIRWWVLLTGRTVSAASAAWLRSPIGPRGRIGHEFYAHLARREALRVEESDVAGLVPDFGALAGAAFDPSRVRGEVRDFYERTSRYRLDAWSESGVVGRFFLWLLTTFVSRRMDQLNFPVSSLELAGGMTSAVLPLVDQSGRRLYTGWLRRLASDGRVIYAGLYSVERPARYSDPCVKVSFPVPAGCATVFLRPVAEADGSFRLVSSGARFGDPGFYRVVETRPGRWRVRYITTLRETFHVYVDRAGTLRTEHTIRFLGLTVLRLHYKMETLAAAPRPVEPQTATAGRHSA